MNNFFNIANLWQQFLDFMAVGGYVMPPLVLITIVLWYAITYRASLVQLNKSNPRRLVEKCLVKYNKNKSNKQAKTIIDEAVLLGVQIMHQHPDRIRKNLDVLYWDYRIALKQYKSLITVLLVIAPLLGLLGTVAGMIETFDSLQDMTFISQDGGIAGGISQALVTTQFGLSISIPGLLIHSFINRRQLVVEQELEQLIDIFSSKPHLQQAIIQKGKQP